MKKKQIKLVAEKLTQKWLKENKELLKDYTDLVSELMFFHAKWGIEIGFVFHNPRKEDGRNYGSDDLKGLQELVNNKKAN